MKYDLNDIRLMFGNVEEYNFSRWSSHIVPIILGLNDFSLNTFKMKLLSLLNVFAFQTEAPLSFERNILFIQENITLVT